MRGINHSSPRGLPKKYTPFYVVFGRQPDAFELYEPGDDRDLVEEIDLDDEEQPAIQPAQLPGGDNHLPAEAAMEETMEQAVLEAQVASKGNSCAGEDNNNDSPPQTLFEALQRETAVPSGEFSLIKVLVDKLRQTWL